MKLKVALFTDSFLPVGGGTGRALYNLCVALQENGCDSMVFCPDYGGEQQVDKVKVFRVKGIKLSHEDTMVLQRLQFKKILKAVKEFDPNVIYFGSANGMAKCALRVAKKLNLKCTATIHTKFHMAYYASTGSKLITKCFVDLLARRLNKTDGVTTVCKDMARCLKDYGYRGESEVIYNGVNNIGNRQTTVPEKPNDGIFRFFYCGHLIKVKNIDFSLRALGILKRKYNFTAFEFALAGGGGGEKAP